MNLDVNECEQEGICSVGTHCRNTEGSHVCDPCHSSCDGGCTGDGPAACTGCAKGYEMKEGEGCVDVDECLTMKCPHGEVCVNKDGNDGCEGLYLPNFDSTKYLLNRLTLPLWCDLCEKSDRGDCPFMVLKTKFCLWI